MGRSIHDYAAIISDEGAVSPHFEHGVWSISKIADILEKHGFPKFYDKEVWPAARGTGEIQGGNLYLGAYHEVYLCLGEARGGDAFLFMDLGGDSLENGTVHFVKKDERDKLFRIARDRLYPERAYL